MQLLVTKQHLARHHQMLRRMQCKYLPARSAIRDGQSRWPIKIQSRCNQMQSGARFEMANQDAIKMQSRFNQDAIRCNQERDSRWPIKMQSRCNQDAIRCNQMQSGARFEMANQDAIKMQSGARFERYSVLLSVTQWYSVVLSGTQWYSVVLSGTQWYSVVLSGTQWYSEVLRGPCTQCEYGAVGGEKEKGG
jgi:hypothetical protein